MNKTQLVAALAARLGDRRSAAAAVDGVLSTVVEAVAAGERVMITGFGTFEPRARAARSARNPRTGAAVAVPARTVPVFRPGAAFRAAVAAEEPAPMPTARRTAPFVADVPSGGKRKRDRSGKDADRVAAKAAKAAKSLRKVGRKGTDAKPGKRKKAAARG